MGRAQNTVKRRIFWRYEVVCGWGGGPFSYGEERNAFGYATARGPLAGFKGCRPCRRPRKNRQGSKANWHKNSSVLRSLRLSTFFLCILLWNIFDRFEFSCVNGFFICVHVNILILWFYGFMDLSNCIIVRYIYIYDISGPIIIQLVLRRTGSFFHLISTLLRAVKSCWLLLAASCCTAAAALSLLNTSRQ